MQKVERHQWEDSGWDRQDLPLNIAGICDGSLRTSVKQPFGFDEVPITPKKKKYGTSDPRFKRVVSNVLTDEIAAEARKLSESLARSAMAKEDDQFAGIESPPLTGKASKIPFFVKKTVQRTGDNPQSQCSVEKTMKNEEQEDVADEPAAPIAVTVNPSKTERKRKEDCCVWYNGTDSPDEDSSGKKEDKKKEEAAGFPAKKSVSDCTIHTNMSPADEEGSDECTRVQSFTSATRLSKVDNWITELKPNPEKRRSVITVIGQIQGKSFSALLNEINQRRKLAKELDKHALCETILATPQKDSDREVKNLVTKFDFVSAGGKVVYSARKIYGLKDISHFEHKCEESNAEPPKIGQMYFKINDELPERDVSVSQVRKRRTKRLVKKSENRNNETKGISRKIVENMEKRKLIAALVFIFIIIVMSIMNPFSDQQILSYLNLGKPKTKSWYETLFT